MVYRIFWFTFRETRSKMSLNRVAYHSNIAFLLLASNDLNLTLLGSKIMSLHGKAVQNQKVPFKIQLKRQYFYFDPEWPILKIVWTNFIGRLNEKKK